MNNMKGNKDDQSSSKAQKNVKHELWIEDDSDRKNVGTNH